MRLSGSQWFRRFTWFLIILFSFSSTPHAELCLSCLADLVVPAAYAEEQTEGKAPAEVQAPTETTQATTEGDTQQKETPPEAEKDKDASSQPMMGSGSGGAGENIAGAPSPTVDVSQFAGAATAAIPIEVPPGRKGVSPKIALAYSSRQGNGWIGMGWTIDMGAIQRSTKRGLHYDRNEYVAAVNGSSAELVLRTDWGTNTYGARIEGTLSKYYFNTVTGGWEMTSRDGTRYYYGTTASSRQDFANGTKVFKWCLDRVEDTNGNFMTVSYTKDGGEIYPDRIVYTGNVNTPLNPTHSVTFHREPRVDTPLMLTTDYPVKTAKRLKTIEVRSDGRMVRAYGLAYTTSTSTSRSLLSKVTVYGADAALDGEGTITGGTSLPPVMLAWDEEKTHSFTAGPEGVSIPGTYGYTYPFFTYGDFNGDGKTDIIYYKLNSAWVVEFANGDGAFTPDPEVSIPDPYSYNSPFWSYGDFNGDGKTDIIYYSLSSKWVVMFSNGDGTFTKGSGASIPDPYQHAFPFFAYGDFNGDGKTDIIYYSLDTTWKVMFSNGDGTFTKGSGASIPDPYSYNFPFWSYADFNGDGKTDIIYLTLGGKWTVMFANGDGTFTKGSGAIIPDAYQQSSSYWSYRDFNGDGKTDIIYLTTGGVWKVMFSNGDGAFTKGSGASIPDPYRYGYPFWHYADFNGDGKTDIIYYSLSSKWVVMFSNGDGTFTKGSGASIPDPYSYNFPFWSYADFNGDGKTDIIYLTLGRNWSTRFSGCGADLLTSVTNSLGGQTSLTYTPSSAYTNTLLPFILQTVSSITRDDGRGQAYTTRYSYSGGLFDYGEREFMGFRYVIAWQMRDASTYEAKTETWYHQDTTRKGVVEKELAASHEGHTRQVKNTWTIGSMAGGVTWPRLDRVQSTITDRGYASYSYAIDYTYDPLYLNITREYKYGTTPEEDADTSFAYMNATGPWIIGKPAEVKVRDASGNIRSAKWMTYDAATGNLLKEETCKSDTPATGCAGSNPTQNPVVSYQYTTEGNLSSATDPLNHRTTFTYDATRTYVHETTNALNHVTATTYDPATGKLTKLVPPHLQGTSYGFTTQYDLFGRIVKEVRPDGGYTTYQYVLGNPTFQYAGRTEHIVGGAARYAYTLFDGLGRVYSTQTMGDEGYIVMADTSFDGLGRVAKRSRPYRYGVDTPVSTTITYDGLSRVTTTTYPDGGQVVTSYQGLTRKVQDQRSHTTTSTYDVHNRLKTTQDAMGTLTAYTYDTLGNLIRVIAAKGQKEENTTVMTYDSLGRKRSMTDPDMGYWTYSYDMAGNLTSQTDAKGQTITFTYDALNRLIQKAYPSHRVAYAYDDPSVPYSTGMLTATSDPSGGENTIDSVLAFDVMQRAIRSAKTINGEGLTISKTYDSAGRTLTMAYETDPKRSFSYTYDWAGNLLAVHDGATGMDHVRYADFTASGRPMVALFPKTDGGLVRTAYTYDPYTGRLTRLLTQKARESTKTEACMVHTGEPIGATTYACGLTQKVFDTEQACADMCRQTTGCTPVAFSGKAASGVNGTIRAIAADGDTLRFTCNVCESYYSCPDDINCGWQTHCSSSPCGALTISSGTVSGSVDAGPAGSIRAIAADGDTLRFDCGFKDCGALTISNGTFSGSVAAGPEGGIRTMVADGDTLRVDDGSSFLGTITVNPFCPYGSQYACDNHCTCTKEGACTSHTELSCPQGYALRGNVCTASVCPLGSQYACSGAPSMCTGPGMDVDATLQDLAYEYDLKGNIITIRDTVNTITHTYAYDALDRLITAEGAGNAPYVRTYAYDAIGNITYKSDIGAYAYTYGATPHAVRQAGNISLQYDANGNMTRRYDGSTGAALDIAWNEDNKPSVISRNGTGYIRFTYDGNGQRVKKENILTGSMILYFGEVYEVRNGKGIIHLFANNQRIASLYADGRTQYYHGDHLGSSSVIIDQNGEVKEQIAYYPFGAYRERKDLDPSFPDVHYTFTGQEDDDETGLYNYNARLYDPQLGRFISADSLVPEPGNLQAFNRYSYCLNNPVIYVDPSGHWFGIDDLVEAVIGAIIGGVEAAITGQNIGEGALKGAFSAWVFANIGVGLREAGVIAVTEAGKEMVTNLPAAIAAHAAAGATTGAFNTMVSGGDLGQNMLTGAISAGMAKGLGNYIPNEITGNEAADYGVGLVGHAAIGGISGGITAQLYGDSFGQGFEQGAIAGAYGYVFNKGGAKLRRWLNTYIKPSITPTNEQRGRVSPVKLSEAQIKAQRSYVYRVDRTAYWSCVGEQLASGDWALPMTVALTPHPVATAVGFVWLVTTIANDAFMCRQQAMRGYEY